MFDFQKELVAHWETDVNFLQDGCMTFKLLFEALKRFYPFEHVTITSACNGHLRVNRITSNSIASKPLGGLRNQVNQSQVALEWLNWCDYELRCQALDSLTAEDLMAPAHLDYSHPTRRHYIQHVGNGGECYVPGTPFSVDGFYLENFTVYEFYGCFWHGCPSSTQKDPRRHPSLRHSLELIDLLNPHDAFCGGRTRPNNPLQRSLSVHL